jgi:hypothetical protein
MSTKHDPVPRVVGALLIPDLDLFGVAHVEVLKGPQATFYGPVPWTIAGKARDSRGRARSSDAWGSCRPVELEVEAPQEDAGDHRRAVSS